MDICHCKSEQSVKSLDKTDVFDLVTAGIEHISKGSIIDAVAVLISKEHIAHEHDTGMGDKGVIVSAVDLFS